jgi:mannose-6-phosphate isomerase-like protein (cupin superfamily)
LAKGCCPNPFSLVLKHLLIRRRRTNLSPRQDSSAKDVSIRRRRTQRNSCSGNSPAKIDMLRESEGQADMKIVRSTDLAFVPASHENVDSPGVWKKVLLEKDDLVEGRVQMINWAMLPTGRSFKAHYHEDMQEIFVIMKGGARITVDTQETELAQGDVVVIPAGGVHEMENIGTENVEYVVVGISEGRGGTTVVV